MRGSGLQWVSAIRGWIEAFTIPMRGNEGEWITWSHEHRGGRFTIPMRGNESLNPPSLADGASGLRSP